YTLKINDKNECGEFSKEIVLLDYPKFLTPNNDGYNDLWQLIGLDTAAFTISPIQIYDRFGKIVAIVNPIQGEGWDGLYKNEMLPSSDYWFSLELTDNQGNIKRHRGHFSLVRR
ncbi:MAG: gliding motility-associated-like protein, partial [Flavobacteriales bacterium]